MRCERVYSFPCNYFNFAELFMIIKAAARCFLLLSVAQQEELFFFHSVETPLSPFVRNAPRKFECLMRESERPSAAKQIKIKYRAGPKLE
jgi:hypothetical protein